MGGEIFQNGPEPFFQKQKAYLTSASIFTIVQEAFQDFSDTGVLQWVWVSAQPGRALFENPELIMIEMVLAPPHFETTRLLNQDTMLFQIVSQQCSTSPHCEILYTREPPFHNEQLIHLPDIIAAGNGAAFIPFYTATDNGMKFAGFVEYPKISRLRGFIMH